MSRDPIHAWHEDEDERPEHDVTTSHKTDLRNHPPDCACDDCRAAYEADKPRKDPPMTEPLRWRLWWRFGFPPVIRFISLLPIAEWRQERWIQRVDFWAMDHIGRRRNAR